MEAQSLVSRANEGGCKSRGGEELHWSWIESDLAYCKRFRLKSAENNLIKNTTRGSIDTYDAKEYLTRDVQQLAMLSR
jgi:hypothetical protein